MSAPFSLRLTPGERLVVATHNSGKAREIAALLGGRFEVVTAGSLGLPEPEETEQTYTGNALLKARAAAAASGLPALADDSGLSVAALAGAPGVYSARWAGPDRDFAHAMAEVERKLRETGSPDRGAAFHCALAVAWPEALRPGGPAVVVEGTVAGTVSFPPRGGLGFGYDPIFTPEGADRTFGEMAPEEKAPLTHRARAFRALTAVVLDG